MTALLKAAAILCLTAACALSVHFAVSSVTGEMAPSPALAETPPDASAPPAPLADSGLPAFAPRALIERPLFSPTRTPRREAEVAAVEPPPPPPPPQQESVDPPSYVVGGVVVAPGVRKALLRQDEREPGSWYEHGDTTNEGYTVSFIAPDRVVVERQGHHFDLAIAGRSRQ
jgi:hypothetical protein